MGCDPYLGKGLEVLALVLQEVQSFLCHRVQSKMVIPLNNACCESLCVDKENNNMNGYVNMKSDFWNERRITSVVFPLF